MADPAGIRVGWGFDAHRLNDDPPLLLGGVVASEMVGVMATSDGDVLAHALADAVLGAAVAGDIGDHFPSADPESEGADSMAMLQHAIKLALSRGLEIAHLDATVVSESVPIGPVREQIRASIAKAAGVDVDLISVKATSTDGLGFVGSGEGIAAIAVVTMKAAS